MTKGNKRIIVFLVISIIIHILLVYIHFDMHTNKLILQRVELELEHSKISNLNKDQTSLNKSQNKNKHNNSNNKITQSLKLKSEKKGIQDRYIKDIIYQIGVALESSFISRRNITGKVKAFIRLSPNGIVERKQILESTNPLLSKAVLESISDKYKPSPTDEGANITPSFSFE